MDMNSTVWWQDGVESTSWELSTWMQSLIAACTVGLAGIVPLLIVPDLKNKNEKAEGKVSLQLLLSFAVGSLLGDVFLHLLPEAWNLLKKSGDCSTSHPTYMGCFVLLGIFVFMVVEKMFTVGREEEAIAEESNTKELGLDANQNLSEKCWNKDKVYTSADHLRQLHKSPTTDEPKHQIAVVRTARNQKHIAGYLNLVANAIDNFSHGLAVAASFIVGTKMGLLTTAAILIHEIPHEVGDFAILLKSGFNRWEAAKAQFSTAAIGVIGALFALCASSSEELGRSTNWILPFTAGGFLNIALVSILPDLMKEQDPWESLKQILAIFLGIAVMGAVSVLTE